MLIEGSPPGEMDQAVIRFVEGQFRGAGDVAPHTRVGNTRLPSLEGADDAARHEHPACLTDRVVHAIGEDLVIIRTRTTEQNPAAGPSAAASPSPMLPSASPNSPFPSEAGAGWQGRRT